MERGMQQLSDGVLFTVSVKPNSGKGAVKASKKNGIVIFTASPAVKGLANKEALKLLRVLLGTEVSIHKTLKNHRKTMFASGICIDELKERLGIARQGASPDNG
jgi:uncharacterized protein (TIGR00251 family)